MEGRGELGESVVVSIFEQVAQSVLWCTAMRRTGKACKGNGSQHVNVTDAV
jgi:hypothetical protein